MLTVEPGFADTVPGADRKLPAAWAAPGLAVAGTATGALVGDACAGGLALPASGLALTVAGAVLWLAGVVPERRDRIALSIAAALTLLSIAALHQLFICILGREAMMLAELLQAGGLVLLAVALALALNRRRRTRAAAVQRRAIRAD
jgi:hypothetical protein